MTEQLFISGVGKDPIYYFLYCISKNFDFMKFQKMRKLEGRNDKDVENRYGMNDEDLNETKETTWVTTEAIKALMKKVCWS